MSPVCLILLVFPLVSAQSFGWGPCPTPSVMTNFTLEQYMGRWYVVESFPLFFITPKCIDANFAQRSDGSTSIIITKIIDDNVKVKEGNIYHDPEVPAKMEMQFPCSFLPSSFTPKIPWLVLSTDYTTVSAVYSCLERKLSTWSYHIAHASIVSRERSLAPDALKEAKRVFQEAGIDISMMTVSDQTGCGDE